MSLFAEAEYCSKIVSILRLIKHDHIDDNWRSWLLLRSWEGCATLACVASVSNRVIIAVELKEMEDARKHLLRRPSLGVRGEKMERGVGGGKEVFSPFALSSFGSQLPSFPQKRLILSLTLHQQSQCVNCVTIYRPLYRGSFLRICTSSLRSAFFSKTMIVSWTFERLDLKKASKWVLQAEKKRKEKTERKGGDMREIWAN